MKFAHLTAPQILVLQRDTVVGRQTPAGTRAGNIKSSPNCIIACMPLRCSHRKVLHLPYPTVCLCYKRLHGCNEPPCADGLMLLAIAHCPHAHQQTPHSPHPAVNKNHVCCLSVSLSPCLLAPPIRVTSVVMHCHCTGSVQSRRPPHTTAVRAAHTNPYKLPRHTIVHC